MSGATLVERSRCGQSRGTLEKEADFPQDCTVIFVPVPFSFVLIKAAPPDLDITLCTLKLSRPITFSLLESLLHDLVMSDFCCKGLFPVILGSTPSSYLWAIEPCMLTSAHLWALSHPCWFRPGDLLPSATWFLSILFPLPGTFHASLFP